MEQMADFNCGDEGCVCNTFKGKEISAAWCIDLFVQFKHGHLLIEYITSRQ